MSFQIIRLPDVQKKTALSRSTIYALIKERSFPHPIPLGRRAVGWVESEIDAWIEKRAAIRNDGATK
ncbi:MAG: AlpA family transcriptional regulator [Alphaproteobacteria bacterium]|nr:AlpA family transcriptional regulator [Alphaproteobacteria bacterium]